MPCNDVTSGNGEQRRQGRGKAFANLRHAPKRTDGGNGSDLRRLPPPPFVPLARPGTVTVSLAPVRSAVDPFDFGVERPVRFEVLDINEPQVEMLS